MSVNIKANELVKAILDSSEYKNLLVAKQSINKNQDYKLKVKDLKIRQHEVQANMIQNKTDKSKIDSLSKIYNDIIKIPEIRNYLDTEKRFNDIVVKVLKDISEKIENSLK